MSVADGYIVGTTKVVDHGPASQRWNVVILGDGYRVTELAKVSLKPTSEGASEGTDCLPRTRLGRIDSTPAKLWSRPCPTSLSLSDTTSR